MDNKKKKKHEYEDISIMKGYNAKLNMLDNDSKMSKLIGVMMIVGVMLYFCNVWIIGAALFFLSLILYGVLRLVLWRQKKKQQLESVNKKE